MRMRTLATAILIAAFAIGGVAVDAPAIAAAPSSKLHKHALVLLKADHAKAAQIRSYEKVLARLQHHCENGSAVWFLFEAASGSTSRLSLMRTVSGAVGSATNADCTTAMLQAQAGNPIDLSTPTAAAAPSNGQPCSSSTTWTPLISSVTGISVFTDNTGFLTVQVTDDSGKITARNATVSANQSPWTIEVPGVTRSSIARVDLYTVSHGKHSWCAVQAG